MYTTYGMDVEFFIKKEGKIIPCTLPSHGTIGKDGIQIEYRSYPQSCRDIMRLDQWKYKDLLTKMSVCKEQFVTVDNIELIPMEDKQVGCKPDYNAYTHKMNIKPIELSESPKRSAGGHIHIGFFGLEFKDRDGRYCFSYNDPLYSYFIKEIDWEKGIIDLSKIKAEWEKDLEANPNNYIYKILVAYANRSTHYTVTNMLLLKASVDTKVLEDIIKFCDIFIGVNDVIFNRKKVNKELARRELYGMAGDYRPTKYGFEYRTLSNQWFFDVLISTGYMGTIKQLLTAYADKGNREKFEELLTLAPEARKIINTCNVIKAYEFIQQLLTKVSDIADLHYILLATYCRAVLHIYSPAQYKWLMMIKDIKKKRFGIQDWFYTIGHNNNWNQIERERDKTILSLTNQIIDKELFK